MTRVFIDYARTLWFEKRFSFKQKMMITFTALSYPTLCVFVFMTAILGPISWVIGALNPMTAQKLVNAVAFFVGTSGLWLIVFTALKRENKLDLMKKFVVAALTLGPIVAFINNIAILRALLGRSVMWKK